MASIKPFAVCTDVELGPLLPSPGNKNFEPRIREVWQKIEKNKSSSDPNKTTPFTPRFRIRKKAKKQEEGASVTTPASFLGGVLDGHDSEQEEYQASTIVEALGGVNDISRENDCVPVFYDFDSINMLAQAVHVAFYQHYPLRLGPDVIWLAILQGLAKHIDQNPEGQRKHFVDFEGQKILAVMRDEFVKGSPNNDWSSVFPEFASMIESYIGKEKASTVACDFSTSTPADRICSHIALMDTVKHYFKYQMYGGCGIPSVELMGTVADWESLRAKAGILCQFDDLEWWTSELFPVLDHFVAAAKGEPDVKFWKSVCNLYGASGMWMNYVTGWVQVFFPYLTTGRRAHGLGSWRKCYESGTGTETEDLNRGVQPMTIRRGNNLLGSGLKLEFIPVGVSQAPVLYHDISTNRKYDMTFNAGVVAIVQNTETKAIEPVTGWAVLDHGEIK